MKHQCCDRRPRPDDDQSRGCNSLESYVDRMGMRLPDFSPADPAVWFLMIESNFKAARIVADSTKYAHVMSTLGSRYIEEIRDIVISPPAEHMYDFLKSEVIKRLSPPQELKTRQFLEHEARADRRPQAVAILMPAAQPRRLATSCCNPSG